MDNKTIGQAKQFEEKIDTIKTQFFSALDDFKKYYVYYNKNPEVDEFQNYYLNSKSQLQNMSRDLFLATNSIDKNIENKNSQINKLDSEIKILKDKLDSLTNSNDAGAGLLTDTELLHNQKYTGNWILFGTILGLCYMNKSIVNTYLE